MRFSGKSGLHRYILRSSAAMRKTHHKEGGKAMFTVSLRVQCSDPFAEMLIRNADHTELTIESIVSTALAEVFDVVVVETVRIQQPVECENEDEVGKASGSLLQH